MGHPDVSVDHGNNDVHCNRLIHNGYLLKFHVHHHILDYSRQRGSACWLRRLGVQELGGSFIVDVADVQSEQLEAAAKAMSTLSVELGLRRPCCGCSRASEMR